MEYEDAIILVVEEYNKATNEFPPFNSHHEGYAVILEEMDELWETIKEREKNIDNIKKECVQVAAMALRFLTDTDML